MKSQHACPLVMAIGWALVQLSACPTAEAQGCTSTNGFFSRNSSVNIAMGSAPGYVSQALSNAMYQWNNESCNSTGYDFPKFTPEFPSEANLEIAYNWDISDVIAPSGATVCGFIDNKTGARPTIQLFQRTLKPDNRVLNCPNTVQSMADLIAHELGHYLGLGESSCQGYIMGPMVYQDVAGAAIYDTSRSVKQNECQTADNANFTRRELCTLTGCTGGTGGSGGHGDTGPLDDDQGDGDGIFGGGAACYWRCIDVAGGLTCDLHC